MKISVVIITRNREEDLRRSLDAFLAQTYSNKEIIVLDNQSTDGTREMMAGQYPDLEYLWLPDNFDIRTINLGIEMSSGDIIWRTDDDSFPESPDTFEKVVEVFKQHDDIDIIATEEVSRNNEVWQWYPLEIDKTNIPDKGFQSNVFSGTGAAIRRKVYDKIGGFWEFGFEEIDFCTRAILAGFNVRYFPNFRVLHYSSTSERFNDNRWIKLSKQLIRYIWKNFPLKIAFKYTAQVYLFQSITAVISRVSFLTFIEGLLTFTSTIIKTVRNERKVVPEDKIHDITLGISLSHSQIIYFKQVIRNQIKKLKKS